MSKHIVTIPVTFKIDAKTPAALRAAIKSLKKDAKERTLWTEEVSSEGYSTKLIKADISFLNIVPLNRNR